MTNFGTRQVEVAFSGESSVAPKSPTLWCILAIVSVVAVVAAALVLAKC